ncbi:hypothetical protein ZEAMMB73_Zm00001d053134 [Zea mays]|uniref:Uncharacterized protein n=1 Tax=Zea mays TaxID=4577 RepID=A0A1D6QMB9_MAIZE|nr:hypothetical protein ZEAMMB73_Zm00001d053134 [Zea mays]
MMHLMHSGRQQVVGVVRFHFLSKMESVSQVAPVLLTIHLDKTLFITLMHGNGNRVRETMDSLHHQAKYHHRECMGMETMDPSTTIFKFIKYVSTRTTVWVWTSSCYTSIPITMTNWNNITILPTCLSNEYYHYDSS